MSAPGAHNTWSPTPGGAFDIMDILGKDESLRRIKAGIHKLETELES